MIFNSEPGARINYISNCKREEVALAMGSLLEHWKEGMPDIQAHEVQ